MSDLVKFFFFIIFVVLVIASIPYSIKAHSECGLQKSLIYGKNTVMAYYMGWCDNEKQ